MPGSLVGGSFSAIGMGDVRAVGIVLGLVALATAVATVAERLRAPAPSLLVLAGLVVGMLPGVPAFEVSPEVVSLVVLPPLLYAAATDLSLPELRAVLGPVVALAVGLVAVTAFAVALVVRLLLPQVSFAAALGRAGTRSPSRPRS